MNLFTRKIQTFCISNLMVSFVCTGFLGINGYKGIIESNGNAQEISPTLSDTEPLSQLGKEDEKDNTLVCKLPAKKKEETTKNTAVQNKTSAAIKKTAVKVTNVVRKKEVKNTVTYAPASYSSVTGDAIVSYAKRYLGLRYKSGTPSLTNGADCSGFTQLIFKEFGVSLPRTVSGQIGRGTYVKKSDLQKGDLVFYKAVGSRGGASHVSIYIGGGQVIHESRPGVGVKISSVNMMQYVTARRVINSKAKAIAEQKQLEEQKKEEIPTDNSTNTDVTNNTTTDDIDNNIDNNVVENVTNDTSTNITNDNTSNGEVEEVKKEEKQEEKKEEIKVEVKEETNNQEESKPVTSEETSSQE